MEALRRVHRGGQTPIEPIYTCTKSIIMEIAAQLDKPFASYDVGNYYQHIAACF